MTCVDRAIAEADRLDAGKFDGLLGNVPDGAPKLAADIVRYLRYYLTQEKGLSKTRVRDLVSGDRRADFGSLDDGTELAVGILRMVFSATRVHNQDKLLNLVFGKLGALGKRHQEGTKKGGRNAAQRKAAKSAADRAVIQKRAEQLTKAGKPHRSITGIIKNSMENGDLKHEDGTPIAKPKRHSDIKAIIQDILDRASTALQG
jgi:hypothetical protein